MLSLFSHLSRSLSLLARSPNCAYLGKSACLCRYIGGQANACPGAPCCCSSSSRRFSHMPVRNFFYRPFRSPPFVSLIFLGPNRMKPNRKQHQAMATSQHLSSASASEGPLVIGLASGRATPPEMERPPPFVKDVLAMQVNFFLLSPRFCEFFHVFSFMFARGGFLFSFHINSAAKTNSPP